MVVKQELVKQKLQPAIVSMGEVELQKPVSEKQLLQLNNRLKELGFEILDNPVRTARPNEYVRTGIQPGGQKQKRIEKIKNLLIKKVQPG